MTGFEGSAWVRTAVGGVFCLAAVALVWLVERAPERPAPPAPAPAAARQRLLLAVDSSCAVAQWRVSVLGAVQAAELADPYRWQGLVELPAGEEVLVQAAAAPPAPPNRALRLRLGDAPERLVWGSGDMAVTVAAP